MNESSTLRVHNYIYGMCVGKNTHTGAHTHPRARARTKMWKRANEGMVGEQRARKVKDSIEVRDSIEEACAATTKSKWVEHEAYVFRSTKLSLPSRECWIMY